MSTVKVSDFFKTVTPQWPAYYITFYNYKICGELPGIFGRDEALDIKALHHIHLAADSVQEAKWRRTKLQSRRANTIGQPENDYWLIYAYDDYKDEYLLLTIVGPDAHSRKEWGSYLRDIKAQIVDPWVNGKVEYPEIEL